MAECTCAQCGVAFRPPRPSQPRRFCGNECRYVWMRAGGTRSIPDRECPQCGAVFRPKGAGQVCCSRACVQAKRAAQRPSFECKHCGQTFTLPPSSLAWFNPQFCGWDCRVASGSHRTYRSGTAICYPNCSCCGRLFVMRAKRQGRYEQAFCSMECRNRRYGDGSRRTVDRLELVCRRKGCGRTISDVYASKIRSDQGMFCSRACSALELTPGTTSKISIAAVDEWAATDGCLWAQEYILGPFAIDLALPLEQIAVELDGEYWHSLPSAMANDKRKNTYLAKAGWAVVRVPMLKKDTPEMVAQKMIAGIKQVRRQRKREARKART